MQLLPVIDLKGKVVVRGVAGQRHQYQPIRSQLAADPSPGSVARAFERRGFRDVYVADLDAISGGEPDWDSYEQIAAMGLKLILDAGVATSERAQSLAEYGNRSQQLAAAVIASESIPDRFTLQAAWEILGTQKAIFSLDLKQARPIVARSDWNDADSLEILSEVYAVGYRRLIILDLFAVGRNAGPATLDVCRQVRVAFPQMEVISGGGVRGRQDVEMFCDAGCDRVLVASALHDGKL